MKKRENVAAVKQEPCIVTGRYGVDCAHIPYRRSEVRDDGLLFLVPLVRDWHTLVDDYHEPYRTIVTQLASDYFRRRVMMWKAQGKYLGHQWRIDEVMEEIEHG